jgi:hypothetical protein
MNYKNMFLIMVSLLVLIGVSEVVNADYFRGNITEVKANSSVVYAANGTEYYLRGRVYTFNISIQNLNTSHNITTLNISLDPAFKWGGSNATRQITTTGGNVSTQFTGNASTGMIKWNGTLWKGPLSFDTLINASNVSYFTFNATVNSSLDALYNFTIWAEFTGGKNVSYTIRNMTVDNTAPTVTSAATNSSTTINVTFTDVGGIKARSANVGVANVTGNGTGLIQISGISDRSSDNKTLTIQVNSGFPVNDTPKISLNGSITDWAGNNMTLSNITAVDRVKPSLKSTEITYNYSTRNLTLIFNEPIGTVVNVSGIILSSLNNNVHSFTLDSTNTSYTVYGGKQNKTVITLSEYYRDEILGWKPVTKSLNITANTVTVNDTSGNILTNVTHQALNSYKNDTTQPYLVSASYSHATRMLNLTFSEAVVVGTFSVNNITIGNQSNLSTYNMSRQINLFNASVETRGNSNQSSINITLTVVQAYNLSAWRKDTLYIASKSLNNVTLTDLSGNNMTPISNGTAKGYINSSTYTKDTTSPGLNIAIGLSDPSPTKAGTVVFNISFDEYMDKANLTINVSLQPNESSNKYILTSAVWVNYTFWNGSFTINDTWADDVGDGRTIINVTGAQDAAGNAMTNATNTFVIDTTLPTLTMVWYNDTGSDYNETTGVQVGTDFLILKFSENMTIVNTNSTATNPYLYLANSSSKTTALLVNRTRSQGGVQRSYFRLSDYTKIRVAINKSQRIWLRGIYNGTSGRVHGIILVNGTKNITDGAGNPLSNSSGVKDIYDNALTLTATGDGTIGWTGFSVPHEINTDVTSNALAVYTSQIYTHTGSAWVSTAIADIVPYRGYLLKVTGLGPNATIDIPIAVPLFGGANPDNTWTTSVSISDGAYSLVGVDGYLRNDDTDVTNNGDWLGSLSPVTTVSNFLDTTDTATPITPTAISTTGTVKPYKAYWIWTASNGDANYDFAGYGRW